MHEGLFAAQYSARQASDKIQDVSRPHQLHPSENLNLHPAVPKLSLIYKNHNYGSRRATITIEMMIYKYIFKRLQVNEGYHRE